jgi:L-alanine-DL-glutamate epimerase-like enolase superfamily enzyme
MLFDRLGGLDLEIDGYGIELRERDTTSGFTRTTTVVSLHGDGHTGRGEDVTYDSEPHHALTERGSELPLSWGDTFAAFSDHLDGVDLFPGGAPERSVFRNYRRWAVESAALDLALCQAGTDLASRLGREYDPVRFIVSTRLGDPPTGDRVFDLLDREPDLEFKLDPTSAWTPALVERLADTGAVRILDLKGLYDGTEVDVAATPELYELVLDGFPGAIVEDPDLTNGTRSLFEGHEGRVSWDHPIEGVDSVRALPREPDWLNVKPSRFGSVESLLDTVEYAHEHDIRLYGGGQFELGAGRAHLHALASLFYPDGPNDIAPRGYNVPDRPAELPGSPLDPPADPVGLEW